MAVSLLSPGLPALGAGNPSVNPSLAAGAVGLLPSPLLPAASKCAASGSGPGRLVVTSSPAGASCFLPGSTCIALLCFELLCVVCSALNCFALPYIALSCVACSALLLLRSNGGVAIKRNAIEWGVHYYYATNLALSAIWAQAFKAFIGPGPAAQPGG